MISFEPELERLRPILGDAVTNTLLVRERREVFSVYPELRIAAWVGAMLVATAAGIVLKNNLDRIGPLALAVLIGLAAAACYAWVVWRRRPGGETSIVDDYVLLLGALLVSADVGFIEQQFKLLGDAYARHFLFLAIVHGFTAYVFNSKMVLSLSISALATWLGVEWKTNEPWDLSARSFFFAALLVVWRVIDARLRSQTEFSRLFEHFAANFAIWGGIAWIIHETRPGCLVTIAIAAVVIAWGFRTRTESFVLYGFIYAVIAADILLVATLKDEGLAFLIIVVSSIAAIAALIVIHGRFKRMAT